MKKQFQDKNTDLNALVIEIEQWFQAKGYQTQSQATEQNYLVQAQKKEAWRKTLGISRAFNILIEGMPNKFSVETGVGEWASNLTAVGITALLTGGASLLVQGVATGWIKKIEADVMEYITQRAIFGKRALSEAEATKAKKLQQLQEALNAGIIDEIAYQQKKNAIECEN